MANRMEEVDITALMKKKPLAEQKEISQKVKDILQNDKKEIDVLDEPVERESADRAPVSSLGRYLTIMPVEVDEVILEKVVDSSGRYSDLLDTYAAELNSRSVPLEITQILDQVMELKRYSIFECRGKRFATSKTADPAVIQKYCDDIKRTLEAGEEYCVSLWETVQYDGKMVENLALTPAEWSIIVAKFRRYSSGVLKTKDNEDLLLIVEGLKNNG